MFRKLTTLFVVLMLATAASAQVMINEVLYDTGPGDDDPNLMFTEIYGPPGTNLTGWSLVGINGNGGAEYRTVPITGSIPADGYFVVGNTASVPNVDFVCGGAMGAGVDWQNAGSTSGDDCDGLDLRNGATVVDHVCYGPCAAGHICTPEGASNAPDPFPSGGINRAIARIPDHSDTDQNGVDWATTETLTPGAPNSGVPCQPVYTTLSAIRENDGNGVPQMNGTFVIVRGIVNVNNYVLDSLTESNFYIQDDDAGCDVFRGAVPAGIMEGDCVVVSGWVGQYNGLTELMSTGAGNCVFDVEVVAQVDTILPQVITTQSYFEAFEGMLVRMNGLSIVDGTWPGVHGYANITVTDGSATIVLRIDEDTFVGGTPAPTAPFGVLGILTQYDNASPYNSGYQITLRYPSDVLRGEAVDDGPNAMLAHEFVLAGSYPNPFNSTAQIRFTVGSARELDLVIFDVLGREMTHQKLTGLTPGAHTYSWTPSGATGLYLLRLSGQSRVESAKLLYLK